MKHFFLISTIPILFFACNESEKLEGLPSSTESKTINVNNNNTDTASTILLPTNNNNTSNTTNLQTTTATLPQNVVTNEKASNTNPAHGQPGHVCGTPAPNTSTTKNQPTATATTPQIITSPKQVPNAQQINMPAPVATKAGMNPPHGQAGHRCDITVGAPLNSAPKKADAPAMTTPQNITQQVNQEASKQAIVNPVPSATATPSAAPTANKGKPNPAHGQPGHDCKVTVGQPLP